MSQYSYKAVDRGGGHVKGLIEAVDRRSAVAVLADKGHFVTELFEKDYAPIAASGAEGEEKAPLDLSRFLRFGSRKVSSKDVLAMTTQLSTALQAGLPLLNGLELILEQQHKPGMIEMLGDLVNSVSSGQSLSEAMEKHEKAFNPLYLSMIPVGETGGMLEED